MPITYTTKWIMSQEDIDLVSAAGQWNSWALQIDGTGHYVTWMQQQVWQEININMVEEYGAYVSDQTHLKEGTQIQAISNYPVVMGGCYSWTGSNLVKDVSGVDCDPDTVMITNNSTRPWTFGLTKLNPITKVHMPLCADLVLQMQPVRYTPHLIVFAKVGRFHKSSTLITDIGSWAQLEINKIDSVFHFNRDSSEWTV